MGTGAKQAGCYKVVETQRVLSDQDLSENRRAQKEE